jgi:hypothetical protein
LAKARVMISNTYFEPHFGAYQNGSWIANLM